MGPLKNISTVGIHCSYIKDVFAGLCEAIFEEKDISEDNLVAAHFHLNSEFLMRCDLSW